MEDSMFNSGDSSVSLWLLFCCLLNHSKIVLFVTS